MFGNTNEKVTAEKRLNSSFGGIANKPMWD